MSIQKANTWCRICGTEYYHCQGCEEKGSWRLICDTPLHYQIYMVIYTYNQDKNKEAARETLKTIGFKESEMESFIPAVRNVLNEILAHSDIDDKIHTPLLLKKKKTDASEETEQNNEEQD